MNFLSIFEFLNKPLHALLMIIFFIIVYFLTIGFTSGFKNNFLAFGPTFDETGKYTYFMGIELDSWKHIIITYVLIFIASVMNSYYNYVVGTNLHSYLWNPAVSIVPYSKIISYFVLLVDPLINIILYIIQFYATATFQVQFIIPLFLGSYLSSLPFTLKWLGSKKFIT